MGELCSSRVIWPVARWSKCQGVHLLLGGFAQAGGEQEEASREGADSQGGRQREGLAWHMAGMLAVSMHPVLRWVHGDIVAMQNCASPHVGQRSWPGNSSIPLLTLVPSPRLCPLSSVREACWICQVWSRLPSMLYVNKRLMLLADTVMSLEKITVMGPGPVMRSWSLPSDGVKLWTWEMARK